MSYFNNLRKVIANAGWTPAELFANGEQGAWYDPSDLSTLFQDNAGTTPVTTDGDPVRLWLDKSGNNNHADDNSGSYNGGVFKTDGGLNWVELGSSTGDRLIANNIGFALGSNPSHIFVAGQFLSAASANDGFCVINTLQQSNEQRAVGFQGDTETKVDSRSGNAAKVTIDSSQNKHVYEGYFSGTTIRSTVDNNLENTVVEGFNTTEDNFQIGKGIVNSSRDHRNFGMVLTGYELTNDNRGNISAYLANKMRISI